MKKVLVAAFVLVAFCMAGSVFAASPMVPMSAGLDRAQTCAADLTTTSSLGSIAKSIDPSPALTSPTNDMQATSNGEAYCIVRCMAGYRCVPDANGGKCVPDPEPQGPSECGICMEDCPTDTHLVQKGNCDCVCVPNSQ